MKLTPKTEAEVMRSLLLEKGAYPFTVRKAEETKSKAGQDMIKLTLSVYSEAGSEFTVYDYLIVDLERLEFKIRHFFDSIGLIDMYESGDVNVNRCEKQHGECRIFVKEDKTGQYAPSNAVGDYVKRSEQGKAQIANAPAQEESFVNDEIPF